LALSCRVEKLQPDMVLNENIYDSENVLLLARGTILTVGNINIIRKLGLEKINVFKEGELPRPLSNRLDPADIKEFQNVYSRSKDDFKGLLRHISAGNSISLDKAYSIPGSLLANVDSQNNLFAYLNRVDGLDDITHGHSVNVALICAVISKWLGLDRNASKELIVAGLLHDVGKSKVPPGILNKPGNLSDAEWVEIKKHPLYGYHILKEARVSENLLFGALLHHEREDGSGYPLGLKRGKIPAAAMSIAIADIYDAMTSNRSYRAKMCPFEVIRMFQRNYFGLLETGMLMKFINHIAECYLGELVRLSDGREGEVVFINPRDPARPIIQLADSCVNLEEENHLAVESIISGSAV